MDAYMKEFGLEVKDPDNFVDSDPHTEQFYAKQSLDMLNNMAGLVGKKRYTLTDDRRYACTCFFISRGLSACR